MEITTIQRAIRDVPDFPQKGIIFKDISPVLQDPKLFHQTIDALAHLLSPMQPEILAGIEARGFIFASVLAYRLQCGMTMIRKKGKLPWQTVECSYQLEYGSSTITMHRDGVKPGQRVVIIDDVLATGGTAKASIQLIQQCQGKVVGCLFFLELSFLNGRQMLQPYPVNSLIVL